MSKSFKAAALMAVAAMVLSAPVFVQPVYGQSSPASTATAGVFTSDVDDSMDVLSYSGVEFEKWFGFVGVDSMEHYEVNPATSQADINVPSLGYAARFGGLYLGAFYQGNILSTSNAETKAVVSNYNLDNQLLTGRETTVTYSDQFTTSYNSLKVLIGVAGMGIKVGFAEALRVWNYPEVATAVTEDANGVLKTYQNDFVDDYERINGRMVPSLEWGMNIDLGGITFKPTLGVDFGIYRDTYIYNVRGTASGNDYTYDTFNGEVTGPEQINYTNGAINDYLKPEISVGLGFDFASGASVGISYGIGFEIYSNDYDRAGFSGTALGTVSWGGNDVYSQTSNSPTIGGSPAITRTIETGTLAIAEITNVEHSITPSFSYSKEIAENFNLGFYAEIPVGITVSSRSESYEWHHIVKTVYNNAVQRHLGSTEERGNISKSGLEETTEFSIGLETAVGASYALFPGRFTINAGFGINPFKYTNTTTTTSKASENRTSWVRTYDADDNLINEVVSFYEPWTGNPPGDVDATDDTVTDSVKVQNTWAPIEVYAAGGFTFTFNDNLALDMVVGGSGNTDDVNGGFKLVLTQVQVLLSLKF